MRVQSTNPQILSKPDGPPPTPPPPEKPKIDGYTGPADGLSHYDEKNAPLVRGIGKALMFFAEKVEVKGEEKIPTSGSHLVAINHQTYFDAPTMAVASSKDLRFMAAQDQFTGIVGKAITALGTFPVDQAHPMKALETSIDMLNHDLRVGIYPQGHLQGETNEVQNFKEGSAMIALGSKCESIVPIAIHYTHPKASLLATSGAYAAAAAVTAAGLASAAFGGPAVRMLGGILTGTIAGAIVAGGVGAATVKEKDIKNMAVGFVQTAWKGALAGAAVGAVGAYALPGSMWIAAPLSGITGLTTLALARQVANRQHAEVNVGDPIAVAPYRTIENHKEARTKLTADLQTAVGELQKANAAA